jgi:hypothetical protein
MKSWLALILLIAGFQVQAQERASKIFEIGKTDSPPPFIQKTQIKNTADGSFTSDAYIEDESGKIVMTEKVVVDKGQLVSQYVEQLQSSEAWDLLVKDKVAHYRHFKLNDGQKKLVDSEDFPIEESNFSNGPMIESFAANKWDALTAGDSVKFHLSILELQKSVTFTLKKTKLSERNGHSVLVVQMKPANFLISMLVDPMQLEFDITSKKLVYFKGRTPLKKIEGGKMKPFDAEIFYQ